MTMPNRSSACCGVTPRPALTLGRPAVVHDADRLQLHHLFDQRVVVLDFGLVSFLGPEDTTQSTQIVGTPAYLSPEQAQEEIQEALSTPSPTRV